MSAAAMDRELRLAPGIGRGDLANCSMCGKGLMHKGLPFFYRVTIERFGVDLKQVQREAGMEMFFHGDVALATVFSDGRPLANRFDVSTGVLVCSSCSTSATCVAVLAEKSHEEPVAAEGGSA